MELVCGMVKVIEATPLVSAVCGVVDEVFCTVKV